MSTAFDGKNPGLEPFSRWPTQFVIPGGAGRVWYLPDATICVQITATLGDLTLAKDYVASVRALRAMHADAFARAPGVRLVQDFRSLRAIDKEAREYLNGAARRDFQPETLAFNKIAIRDDLVLIRIALYLHALAGTRLGLPRVESVADLGAEVQRLGLTPPSGEACGADALRAFEITMAELRDR